MFAMGGEIPLPLTGHPAVEQYRATVAAHRRGVSVVYVALPVRLPAWNVEAAVEASTLRKLTFTRRQACHPGLLPEYGAWVWEVWTDQYGRSIAYEAEWLPRPEAILLDVWNPTSCEICAGRGTDYLDRPCRMCGPMRPQPDPPDAPKPPAPQP